MRPTKAELMELALLLEGGAETPETLAEDFLALREQQIANRGVGLYCAIVCGDQIVGPWTTALQASKVGKVIHYASPLGWKQHLESVDSLPKPKKDWQEIALDAAAFKKGWSGKASTRKNYVGE